MRLWRNLHFLHHMQVFFVLNRMKKAIPTPMYEVWMAF